MGDWCGKIVIKVELTTVAPQNIFEINLDERATAIKAINRYNTEALEGHFYLLLITYYLLLITYHLLLITTTYYLLLTTYYLSYHLSPLKRRETPLYIPCKNRSCSGSSCSSSICVVGGAVFAVVVVVVL